MSRTTASAGSAATGFVPTLQKGPIVVGVGGKDPDSVLRTARALGPALAAEVVAVSVLTPLPVAIPGQTAWMIPPDLEEERLGECTSELASRLDALNGAAKSWTSKVVRGWPAGVIPDLAREQHAALIIVGMGRHRPLDRLFGAETALRTIQRAPCPVLVVHRDHVGPFRDVVIATDFSPASLAAAQAAMPMLDSAATIHIVHVWQPSDAYDPRKAAADQAYVRSLPESFRRFTELLSVPAGATLKTVTREGGAAERVLDYAESHHADLVTAGRHGRSLLQRILVGSQTSAMVRAAERSLLIAPDPPFAERDRLQLVLAGSTESRNPAEWDAQLRGLSQRNHGRPTVVEVDDILFGAQVTESGYLLLGAAYDANTRRVEITLGDVAQSARRVTRSIGTVDSITIETDSAGRDVGMRITHGGGHTALTFLGE